MRSYGLIFYVLILLASCCMHKNTTQTTVYITSSGDKYHQSYCRYLGKSSVAISISDAMAKGFKPCSDCNPEYTQPLPDRPEIKKDTVRASGITQLPAKVRCIGVTKKGKRCRRSTRDSDKRCFQHKN